jgi:hypothetical protein
MKLKSLLFGSAAVIAAGTGAQAADLPIVEPVEYVRICDAFGTGYYYIPGTDTCLRVAGRVRIESHYVDGDTDSLYGVFEPQTNNWTTRARGYIRLDARTQTEFGLVRAYISYQLTVGPGQATALIGGPGSTGYSGTGAALEYAFIQISRDWGTYTAGHADSFFDFYDHHGYYNARGVGIDASTTAQTLFGWTFAGGNGFSFTIAAEDPSTSFRRLNSGPPLDDDYEGQEAPDGVANIRVDQAWGSAQIMGAFRHIHDYRGPAGLGAGEYALGEDDDFGFAVGGGFSLNVPGGWQIDAMGGYSEGAIGYITSDPGALGDFDCNLAGGLACGVDQNEAWAAKAGITGPIGPTVTAWFDGSFTHVEEADGGDEYDHWGVAAGAYWSPISGLNIGPEFAYSNLDFTDVAVTDGLDESTIFGRDYDVWSVVWRIQRDF